ncbi:MAG: hypothetical protein PHR30_15835 [Gallionellaceae bacterium]|nr:hypothetical protein [Gallionellaceae bacterium]
MAVTAGNNHHDMVKEVNMAIQTLTQDEIGEVSGGAIELSILGGLLSPLLGSLLSPVLNLLTGLLGGLLSGLLGALHF